MYVQYDCHRSSTFRDLLRKRNAAQLDHLGVLCVKFEDNRTSTFRDMLRKRVVYGRPNGPT